MQRVGWIRMGALGDLLVGLASLREVIDRWPGAKVSVIGPKLWLEILEPGFWPQIDQIVVIERKEPGARVYKIAEMPTGKPGDKPPDKPADRSAIELENQNSGRQWVPVSAADWTLRAEMGAGYDVIFNTRVDSPREAFPGFWARVPERWGTAKGVERFIYTHRGTHYGKDPLLHERDVPLLLLDEVDDGSLISKYGTLSLRIENSPRIVKWRQKGLPCPREVAKFNGGQRFLLINPTSSRREKAWPSQKFYELLLGLKAAVDFQDTELKVIGAPSETDWLREVARDEFSIVQPLGIGELFKTVARADLLVANTSSVQFIAAATGTPAVTLMGRARPEIWGPLGPKDLVLRGVEPTDVESIFERERMAYESIAVEKVHEAVLQQWRSARE